MLEFLVKKRTTFTWLIPLVLLGTSLVYGHWSMKAYAVGLVLLILGEVVRFWAAGTIHKDDVVATGGPYALVRNPLYFGSLLLAAGYAAMSGLPKYAWIIVVGLFTLFHLAAIVYEERFLKSKFGAPYEQYLRHVPRLIPRPWPSKSLPAGGASQFSAQQAIYNREHITAMVTFATAVLFALALHKDMLGIGH
jgi:protein-S-isoprenylcysteine O-methyltransferase Ste14